MRPFRLILPFLQFPKCQVNSFICSKSDLRATVSNPVAGTLPGLSRPSVEVSVPSRSLNLSSIFHVTTTPHFPPKHCILNQSRRAVLAGLEMDTSQSRVWAFGRAGGVQVSGRPFSELSQLLSTLRGEHRFQRSGRL